MSSESPVLLADIGGTHSRFALLASHGRPEQVVSWDNDRFASLEDAIAAYLIDVSSKAVAAVLAIAGPVTGRTIALTNRHWSIDLDHLAARFHFSRADAINDFEAQAWALTQLQSGDYRTLGEASGARSLPGVKVVLGPGTGLGVAALVPVGTGWQPIATEGGHVSFGAASKNEEPVFARLHESGPVSAESVVSGSGLPRLHTALNPGVPSLPAETIVKQAQAGDAAAAATIKLFVRLLGRFSGDVALTFKAVGGVYIAGGVAGKLGPLLDEKNLRDAFEAHPPYNALLKGIPTYLVTVAHPGLIGCAAFATAQASASIAGVRL